MFQLPNYLTVNFRYVEHKLDEHMRLRNFMSLDLASCTQRKYLSSVQNPFAPKEGIDPSELSTQYELKSLVAYEQKDNYESCYVTYNRNEDGSWIKITRSSATPVEVAEVEAIALPHSLVYERVWSAEPERTKLVQEVAAEKANPSKCEM